MLHTQNAKLPEMEDRKVYREKSCKKVKRMSVPNP